MKWVFLLHAKLRDSFHVFAFQKPLSLCLEIAFRGMHNTQVLSQLATWKLLFWDRLKIENPESLLVGVSEMIFWRKKKLGEKNLTCYI